MALKSILFKKKIKNLYGNKNKTTAEEIREAKLAWCPPSCLLGECSGKEKWLSLSFGDQPMVSKVLFDYFLHIPRSVQSYPRNK